MKILSISIVLAGIFGWCLNIYKLCYLDFNAPYKAEVVRVIGVFTGPVGSVIGYLNFDEEKSK